MGLMASPTFRTIDLAVHLAKLYEAFPQLTRVHLFGSRMHRTGSARSDIDLLATFRSSVATIPVGDFAYQLDPYLDVFVANRGSAVSSINGSRITFSSEEELLADLDAELIWENGHWVGDEYAQMQPALACYQPGVTMMASGPLPRTITVGPLCDYLIVTALEEEYSALVALLSNVRPAQKVAGVPPFSIGEVKATSGHARRVAICALPRMGLVSAALTTSRLLDYIAPELVVLVGITGGLEGQVLLGDIVIPGETYEYEAVKVTTAGEEPAGLITPVSADHIAAVKQQDLTQWRHRLSLRAPNGANDAPAIHIGDAMASGQKVMANAERAAALRLTHRKTIAVEMEAFGVAAACSQSHLPTPFLVLKSVSDYANAAKDDAWRRYCCEAAADLVVHLIRVEAV
jgi:5'-methylthioadenosine/S-adenosylhomocysteine nucleosidase